MAGLGKGLAERMSAISVMGRQRKTDSFGDFIDNVGLDARDFVEGLKHLPELGKQLVTSPVSTVSDIGSAVLNSYIDLFKDPVGTFLRNPLFTVMDLAPVGGIGLKGVRTGLKGALKAGLGPVKYADEIARVWSGRAKSLARQASDTLWNDYYGITRVARYHNAVARKFNLKKTRNKSLREDMVYYINGTHNPALDEAGTAGRAAVKKRLQDAGGKYWERAQQVQDEFKKHMDAMNESELLSEVLPRENYITMLFKPMSQKKLKMASKKMLDDNPFASEAQWHTYVEAMEKAGLEMKFKNVEEILEYYKNTTMLAHATSTAKRGMLLGPMEDGLGIVSHVKGTAGRVPVKDFKLSPAMVKGMRKQLQDGTLLKEGIGDAVRDNLVKTMEALRTGKGFMSKEMFEGAWGSIKPSGLDNLYAQRLMNANAVMKKISLSASMFHHFALTESNMGLMGIRRGNPLWSFGKDIAPGAAGKTVGEMYGAAKRSHRKGLFRYEHDVAFAEELHRLGIIGDVPMEAAKDALMNFADRIEGMFSATGLTGKVFKGANSVFQKGVGKFDAALWDHYYTGMKAYAYSELLPKMRKKLPHLGDEAVKLELADILNDAFGGQVWGRLRVSKQMQQTMGIFLMAPDWTISNIKIAERGLRSLKRSGHRALLKTVGKEIPDHLKQSVTDVLGRQYWGNMALSQFVMGNMTNFLFSGITKTEEKGQDFTAENIFNNGHFMWDNEKGNKTLIVDPRGRDEKGRNMYIKIAKQVREPFQWVSDPIKTFGGKMAPATQALFEQVFGFSTTAFPQAYKDKSLIEGIPERIASVGGKMVPISLKGGNQFMFMLPARAATSGYRLIRDYKHAMILGDKDEIKALDELAEENGFNAKTMKALAKRDITKELKKRNAQ